MKQFIFFVWLAVLVLLIPAGVSALGNIPPSGFPADEPVKVKGVIGHIQTREKVNEKIRCIP